MRMFGLGATLALAMLASTSLTSCYDSEHLDVTAPIVLDDPEYVVSGYVWDFVTNDPLQGVSVTAPGGSATTDATGYYSIASKSAQNGTISFSLEGYISQARNISMKNAQTGLVSYNADCFLINENDIPGIQLIDVDYVSREDSWVATENFEVDLVNDSSEAKNVSLTFGNLQEGAAFEEAFGETKVELNLPDEVKARVASYCKAHYGIDPSQGFSFVQETKKFTLPAFSSMYSVDLVQYGVSITLQFKLDGVEYAAIVNACDSREYEPTIKSNSEYHGHGHGHNMHGAVLNAGGGIFE